MHIFVDNPHAVLDFYLSHFEEFQMKKGLTPQTEKKSLIMSRNQLDLDKFINIITKTDTLDETIKINLMKAARVGNIRLYWSSEYIN